MRALIVTLLVVVSFPALAGGSYNSTKVINNIVIDKSSTQVTTKGIASAIAQAQCHFDRSTYDLQGCGSTGHYKSRSAFNVGLGKRLNKKGDLLSFGISTEDGELSYGAGYNWKF